MTWILRFVGWFFLFAGLGAVLGPLKVIADKIPLIGGLIGGAVWLFSFLTSSAISLGLISIGWIIARPLVGIILCVLSMVPFVGIIALLLVLKKKK